jgi:ribosomal protein L11 methyltransferase
LSLNLPQAQVAAFESALEDHVLAITIDEDAVDGLIHVEGLFAGDVEPSMLLSCIEAAGIESPDVTIEAVPETDWVAASQAGFPAFRAGRYYVHGSHLPAAEDGGIDLEVDAGAAFGTGILTMAMAKTWQVPVVASDIDPAAVTTAQANAGQNGVDYWVQTIESDGYAHSTVAAGAPYDLITANILAGPLTAMAPDLADCLAPGGVAILAGLLSRQTAGVTAAHEGQGLVFKNEIALGDWRTLILRLPADKNGGD